MNIDALDDASSVVLIERRRGRVNTLLNESPRFSTAGRWVLDPWELRISPGGPVPIPVYATEVAKRNQSGRLVAQ